MRNAVGWSLVVHLALVAALGGAYIVASHVWLILIALGVAVDGGLVAYMGRRWARDNATSTAALRLQARFLQEKLRELTTLHDIAQGFTQLESPRASYRYLVEKLADLLHLRRCALFILDEESLELVPNDPAYGMSADELAGLRIPLSQDELSQRFWQSREPVYYNDVNVAAEADAVHIREWFKQLEPKSVIVQTVWVGQQPVGIIFGFDKRDGSGFGAEDSRLIAILATQASVAINNSRLFDQVQLDLDVKTALLQEINHRVRNNLASIVGLLSMELMRPEPRPAKTVLMNSINRVKSIGQVHTMLSEDSFGAVDFQSIAEAIVGFVTASWGSGRRVQVDVGGDPVVLDPKRAGSLALVVNELITNSLKYAFPDQKEGLVEIRSQIQDGEVAVMVRDNGVGLPADFDPERAGSLGMRIIRNLVRTDLKGRFSVQSEGGTVANIVFPMNPRPATEAEPGRIAARV
ncbi:MAG TPA: histidine kinase dimerization/phosphoacceptor domain -containing protein [Chloroflexota bacterium]|jgi:two-component sensor histidine kinase|nr:histidine kinase dimerization/phosphoacceptor domain -containing protein [Chloroflexota bacterium]